MCLYFWYYSIFKGGQKAWHMAGSLLPSSHMLRFLATFVYLVVLHLAFTSNSGFYTQTDRWMDEHPQTLFIYIDLTFVLVGIINPNSAGLLDVA